LPGKPKYASFIGEAVMLRLDSAAFLDDRNCSYVISDRSKNEDPRLKAGYIWYPRGRCWQFRLSVGWSLSHVESPSYYAINPSEWREKIWIIVPIEELDKLIRLLLKPPSLQVAAPFLKVGGVDDS